MTRATTSTKGLSEAVIAACLASDDVFLLSGETGSARDVLQAGHRIRRLIRETPAEARADIRWLASSLGDDPACDVERPIEKT